MSRSIINLLLILLIFGGFFTALFYMDISREAQFVWTDIRNLISPLRPGSVEIGENVYCVRFAETPKQRSRGLMFHRSLPDGHGMLFPFAEPGLHGIWMKNVYFPLDIFWIQDERVVDFFENAPKAPGIDSPPSYHPDIPANYVLELPAGTAAADGITEGAEVRINDSIAVPGC